jgi:membrane protein implicated in regulation of membrane protease activity
MDGSFQIWHVWVVLGIVLFIVELFTPSFFAASLGVAVFGVAIAAAFSASPTVQMAIFVVTAIAVFFAARPFFMRTLRGGALETRTGVQALIGREALVVEPIDNTVNAGRVKIAGEFWKAASADGRPVPDGSTVVVERIEGVTAVVRTH